MKEDKTLIKNSSSKENISAPENGKKKTKEEKPATKVVVRRLPPTMTEEQFKMQVSPLPDIDYFYFVPADMSLSPNAFTRAYLNFVNQSDLFIFTQKFDGYVFLDSKGGEFPAIVEFAPFQRIPKNRPNRKKDPKVGTIETDPLFIAFKERLEAEILENKASASISKQHFFETSLIPDKKEANNTPLLDYIKNRRAEKQKMRDEKREEKRKKDLERRKAKEEQRRAKKEDDSSVVKTSPSPAYPESNLSEISLNQSKNESHLSIEKDKPTNFKLSESKNRNHSSDSNLFDGQKLSKKVYDLVQQFNKPEVTNKTLFNEKEQLSMPSQKYLLHADIEKEILRNVEKTSKQARKNYVRLINNNCNKNYKKPSTPTLVSKKNSILNESPKNQPCYLVRSQSNLPRHTLNNWFVQNRDIIMKPTTVSFSYRNPKREQSTDVYNKRVHEVFVRDTRPVHGNMEKGNKPNLVTKEHSKPLSNNNFSGEMFRKKTQKVDFDRPGNIKMNNSREMITKPSNRIVVGCGDQQLRSGFNSTSFYLPNRASDCMPIRSRQTVAKSSHSFCQPNVSVHKSITVNIFKNVPRNLPPFSRNVIVHSKSDGFIEKYENDASLLSTYEHSNRKNVVDSKRKPFARRI